MKTDFAIIGAGVVGCAIARELSLRHPKKKIVVLEKLAGPGLETSRFNSGVLHSGLHQNPSFLKSKLVQGGGELAAKYVKANGLPILNCGMIIAVSRQALQEGLYREWKLLLHLLRRGRAQGVKFKFLTGWGVRKLEPRLRTLGGIFIPNVQVIDPLQFVQALHTDAKNNGVRFLFGNPVLKIKMLADKYEVSAGRERIISQAIINAAGLYADDVARLAGFSSYKIYPWRGEYYEVISEKRKWVSRLIYPATPSNSPGKGIHFSPRVDGQLFIGPNARLVPKKNYYTEDKTPVDIFLKAAQKFFPEITAGDLRWAYSGIRPKLTDKAEETDFIIELDRKSPPFVNLIGIESPGLASSMAIAKYVAEILPPGAVSRS